MVYDGGTIINRAVTSIRVQKLWNGLEEGAEIPEITLTLYCNGTEMARKQPKPDAAGWYEYKNLPKYVGGEEAIYYVMENPLDGFVAMYTDENGEPADAAYDGFTITNHLIPATGDELLVSVKPEEFPFEGPLGGMYWQRQIEERAYAVSGSYRAPAQKVGDFLAGRASADCGEVNPTYRPGVHWCDLHDVLPEALCSAMEEALPKLDGNLKGFASDDAVLTAPETRSSSPVRILRGEDRQSKLKGLYPTGEGAGYAGGIMSAAVDGIVTAEAIINALQENDHER